MKKDFFSKLKNKFPSDEEIEQTKGIIKIFNIKIGEDLTNLYSKSDVFLLTCICEKYIKVSTNGFGINPLYCVSLPGFTWHCGLKYTGIELQTLQDKDMILLLKNNFRGGISSVMGHRYVKSDENEEMLYIDANNLCGWTMIQYLPYDEIAMWRDCLDCYRNKLAEILSTPDDNDFGYLIEVNLKYPDKIKENKKLHFVLKLR